MLADEERIQRIIEHHEREAEDESKREIGEDPLYDGIAWSSIEPFLPKQGRILDAGGGAGVWSVRLAEKSECSIVLFDIAHRLLTTATTRLKALKLSGRVDVLIADIRVIPHLGDSFDFVLCEGDPIAICGDSEKAVSELSRVLKPNGYLAAGLDSTIFRAFKALTSGASLDDVIELLRTGRSPAEDGALFESKSFTPTEFASLAKKHGLEMVRVAGRPIGFGSEMLDVFVSAIPIDLRREIFRENERPRLLNFLRQVYEEPYLAAVGSHLLVVAKKVAWDGK
ncbi:MAG: methyltransferase domain-containing protein [Thaumarchaeota archaeon]|nr:methyltransferase domain-containing protein [Nitrososphaerota archaeon]